MEIKKVLHIVPDDKFIDRFIEIDNSICQVQSFYMIKVYEIGCTYRFVKNEMSYEIVWKREELKNNNFDFTTFDSIFFHTIDHFVFYLLNKIPSKTKLYWFYWGFEKYFLFNKNKLYTPKTTYILKEIGQNNDLSILDFKKIAKRTKDRILMFIVLLRVNYCLTWVKGDYIEMNSIFKNIKLAPFIYYSKEQLSFLDNSSNMSGVVLGNSADPSNNHLDGLIFLSSINYIEKIVIPFSYGGNLKYKSKIKDFIDKKCKSLNIHLLENFLNITDYNTIMNSVSSFLFFHQRQQAAGNYIGAFFMKKPVYFSFKTTIIEQFQSFGFIVYHIDQFPNYEDFDLLKNFQLANSLFTFQNSQSQLLNIYNSI